MEELVSEGGFREDLYFRLRVVEIEVPSLRYRRDDIPLLANHLLGRIRDETGSEVRRISETAMGELMAYGWPGNVRELETVVLGAILACGPDRVVRLENLPPEIRSNAPAAEGRVEQLSPIRIDDDTIVPLAELERRAIAHALRVTGGNVTRAARALGIGRATMYRKLDRFKLNT